MLPPAAGAAAPDVRAKEAPNVTAYHVAIALCDDEGGLSLIEAIEPAVAITVRPPAPSAAAGVPHGRQPAASFWRRQSPGSVFHLGVAAAGRDRALGRAAAAAAAAERGKPYAAAFGPPPAQFYCSSLVEYAYRRASAGRRVFWNGSFPLIFEPPAFWRAYYARMGVRVPANATGSNPTLLLDSGAVERREVAPGAAQCVK